MNGPNRTSRGFSQPRRPRDATGPPRMRCVIAAAVSAAVVILGVLGAAHCRLPGSGPAAPRLTQPVLASLDSQFAATIDQLHRVDLAATVCHKAVAVAVLPPSSSAALAGLGVIVASVALSGGLVRHVLPGGRGPPRGPAAPLTGRDRLTRLCLALIGQRQVLMR